MVMVNSESFSCLDFFFYSFCLGGLGLINGRVLTLLRPSLEVPVLASVLKG